MDVRAKPEHDIKKSKPGNDNIIFSSVIFGQTQRVPGISGLPDQVRQ